MSSSPTFAAAADTASSGREAISTVLPNITKFLNDDVESIVRLSLTCVDICRKLTKVKVPYFFMGDERLWRDEDGRRVSPTPPNESWFDEMSSSEPSEPPRLTSLSTQILPKIDFSSLKWLDFSFGPNKKYVGNSNVEFRDAFMCLALGLETAQDLEEIKVDVGIFIVHDEFLCCMGVYDRFARNLAQCRNLRRIKILNYCTHRGRIPHYSYRFLEALVPAIQGGAGTLEEISLLIGSTPFCFTESAQASASLPFDLFVAILSLRRLRVLDLQIDTASGQMLNNFMKACSHMHQNFGLLPSSGMVEKFSLICILYRIPDGMLDHQPSLAPCLSLLGQNTTELQQFVVRVPKACWDSRSVLALKHLLSNKPRLRTLGLEFHGYECTSSQCLQYILDYIQERENCSDNYISISGLNCYDAITDEQEGAFEMMHVDGEQCFAYTNEMFTFQARGRMICWS